MKRSLIPGVATALLLVLAFASSGSFAAGTTNIQLVKKLSLQSSGAVYVYGTKAWFKRVRKCNKTDFVVLLPGHKFYRETYAALLIARAQQIKVSLKVSGCAKAGGKTRQVISGVNM